MNARRWTVICSALVFSCAKGALAYTITVFPQAAYNTDVATMDATLGLPSNFLFEDFDDNTLIPALHVTGNNTTPDPDTTINFLHNQLRPETGIAWTLVQALKVGGYISPVKFEIVDGIALTFGFGIGEDQGSSARVRINDGAPFRLSDFSNYHTSIGNPAPYRRNGYVKIGVGPNDLPIKTVAIYNGGGDRIYVDHIAMEYVGIPEPSSIGLMTLGALLCSTVRRRKNGDRGLSAVRRAADGK